MFTVKVYIDDGFEELEAVAEANNIESLTEAGAYVRSVARNSIRRSKRASAPGQPPRTRRGALRQSILFSVEPTQQRVFVGSAASYLGAMTGGAHEKGGVFRGRLYPSRPFMGPALIAAAPRLSENWEGIIRG